MSLLEMQAKREDNGKELRCDASNPAVEGIMADSTTITIECKLHLSSVAVSLCCCPKIKKNKNRETTQAPVRVLSSVFSSSSSFSSPETGIVRYSFFVFFCRLEMREALVRLVLQTCLLRPQIRPFPVLTRFLY